MTRWLCLLALMTLAGLAGLAEAQAQQNRLLSVGDWTYDYIQRLQRRGHLLALNPTATPYRRGDVAAALGDLDREGLSRTERHWVALLESAVMPVARQPGDATVGGSIEAGLRLLNSDRLDVVRPLGDTVNVYWYTVIPTLYLDAGRFIANASLRQDQYYNDDPDGLDTARRFKSRSEETYAGYHGGLFSAYLGRWSNHWSVPGEAAVLISDNPRSQDQVFFRLGGQRLAVTGLLTELDSITEDGRFTGRVADDTVRVGNRRRFLAAHRWDWRPSPHLTLALMEGALYSGDNAAASLKYLNPLHDVVFVLDNTPKNDENNGFFAGLLWAQYRSFTLHGQLMIDDFDARKEGDEPISFALAGSVRYAARAFDLGATLEVVTARTYNAPQPEGKYLYLLRGLATQFNDYVHTAVFADVYLDGLVPGLRVTPRLHVLAQGERDPRLPFPTREENLDLLLNGTVERTVRPAVQVYLQPMPWWWVRLDGGVNVVSNAGHQEDVSETRFVGLLDFGLRLSVDAAYRLAFD